MTKSIVAIEKGAEWGTAGSFPDGGPVASNDSEAADFVREGARIIGLSGGDLGRTLGVRAPFDPTGAKQLLPVDVIEVELDNGTHYVGIAHVLVGRLHREREVTALMNAAFYGPLNIAPRAHPGDGKLDVVTMNLRLSDRIKARRRMVSGAHLPHPDIKVRRVEQGEVRYERPRQIRIDGALVGRSSTVRYRLESGSVTIAI